VFLVEVSVCVNLGLKTDLRWDYLLLTAVKNSTHQAKEYVNSNRSLIVGSIEWGGAH